MFPKSKNKWDVYNICYIPMLYLETSIYRVNDISFICPWIQQ